MKRIALALGIALLALPASGHVVQLTQPVINALTPIDSLPSKQQLDTAHGDEQQAFANLKQIALGGGGGGGSIDPGVQLRAVRALPQYCSTPCTEAHEAHITLATVAATPRYRDSRSGTDLLVLRAALEALGSLRVPEDVVILVPQLEHPSRDIRATAAHALRDLGNTQAIVPLRARYLQEQVPQVRLAISDALRVLGQPVQ